MIIILPDQVDGLHSVENKLARASFDGMYNTEVVVRLPKFKMEKEIKLNDILMKVSILLLSYTLLYSSKSISSVF